LGEGELKAAAVLVSTGNKVGEIFGHTDKVLSGIMTPKPYKVISVGESKEILLHAGVPFKGQGERLTNVHEGFINKISLSPDASKFITAGADKNIVIYNSEDQAKQR
jgi:WD40 repeat protein